jgi:hypothetical protein
LNIKLYDHEQGQYINYQNILSGYKSVIKSAIKSKIVTEIYINSIEEIILSLEEENKFKNFLKEVYVPGIILYKKKRWNIFDNNVGNVRRINRN